jgi:signal transduction histidine kinase
MTSLPPVLGFTVWSKLRRAARRGGSLVARPVIDTSLSALLLLVTVLLFWLGYRATREWQRSNLEAANRRSTEVLVLLDAALERDMKGAVTTVLLPFDMKMLRASSRYDLADRFAGAFARFPYLESFFVWQRTDGPATTYFFNRADQPPPWDRTRADDDVYPVLIRTDPPPGRPVIERANAEAVRGARFAVFEMTMDGVPYQAFVHLLFGGAEFDELVALAGFTVNLSRVRENYFQDFVQHVQAMVRDLALTLEIVDERGTVLARTGPEPAGTPIRQKRFPLLFADRSIAGQLVAGGDRAVAWWTARVSGGAAPSGFAERATARTLLVLVLAALVTAGGLVWSIRAARAAAALATAESEFFSAMSHEMKTPLSLIALASDTLATGRYTSPATVPEYGRLLCREAHHLRRLIDNVLCYARLDTHGAAQTEPLDASELIQDSVERFRPLLADLGIEVQVQLPLDVVWIHGDRAMVLHVLDNLIDNAARHGGGRRLTVRATLMRDRVSIEVADAGQGIPPDELRRVFDTFYRGKGTRARGSGLGLAIVRRIVSDHGGTVSIMSRLGEGTTVTILLPAST